MSSFVKNVALLRHAIFFMFFGGKGCNFFLFCDVFRRITTQKQLFFADLRDCVALGMEVFCVHATFLDFGDNLRCMKQVAGLAGAPRNLLICRVILHKPCNLAGRACSVTGCRVILRKPCNLVSKTHSVTGCRVILRKPCNLVSKAHSVTGCRPIKRQSPTASYVSELPTKQREFVFLHGL